MSTIIIAENRKLSAKEDAISRVIRAMRECSGSASVQEAACKAIINLTAKNSKICAIFMISVSPKPCYRVCPLLKVFLITLE